ncbi:MAG: M12 family metallopeptidase [Dehalococcoidia bacterium]
MTDQIRVCIDRHLTPAQARVALRARRVSLAALNDKIWPNGQVIRATFLGGDLSVRNKVVAYAKQWEQHANIRFDFTQASDAQLRIAFDVGGSWSYIGTDALVIPRHEPTMNYGWLTPSTNDAEYSRVVLHEFGHALGCFHEQQHPETGIPWDREAVYAYYAGHPNFWSREEVDVNIFATYSRDITRFSAYDPTSIMHYPIPNELTLGDFEVGWNTVLSPTDQQYAGILYPRPAPPPIDRAEAMRTAAHTAVDPFLALVRTHPDMAAGWDQLTGAEYVRDAVEAAYQRGAA